MITTAIRGDCSGKLYIVDEEGNEHEVLPTEIDLGTLELFNPTPYEPYEPCGKNLFDSGELIMSEPPRCEKTYATCSAFDELCDRVKKIENERKEGINMELLDMYREKSLNNICKYYDELREKEYNKNEAVKAVNDLTEKFRENINKLIEKYGDDIVIYDECYFEDSVMVDIDETEEIVKLHDIERECVNGFEDKIKEIKAHLQLLPPVNETTYDAVMPILKSYGVVDEEGRLTPYNPIDDK